MDQEVETNLPVSLDSDPFDIDKNKSCVSFAQTHASARVDVSAAPFFVQYEMRSPTGA